MASGIVYLVGAGPGDPGLLTVKGKWCLKRADVVVYDRLVSSAILRLVKKKAKLIDVGKESGFHRVNQEQISRLLVDLALQGQRVVRLKGGDPFVFGRGAEEIAALVARGVRFEVVPGVSSAVAVPAYAGIPVTCRGIASSFTVMTGHGAAMENEFSLAGASFEQASTLVILMGLENLRSITAQLITKGWPTTTPVAVIRAGTTIEQEVAEGTLTTIADIVEDLQVRPPGIIVVGEVVRLRSTLSWFTGSAALSTVQPVLQDNRQVAIGPLG